MNSDFLGPMPVEKRTPLKALNASVEGRKGERDKIKLKQLLAAPFGTGVSHTRPTGQKIRWAWVKSAREDQPAGELNEHVRAKRAVVCVVFSCVELAVN